MPAPPVGRRRAPGRARGGGAPPISSYPASFARRPLLGLLELGERRRARRLEKSVEIIQPVEGKSEIKQALQRDSARFLEAPQGCQADPGPLGQRDLFPALGAATAPSPASRRPVRTGRAVAASTRGTTAAGVEIRG